MNGALHDKNTLFLREEVGLATLRDEYELSVNMGGLHPIIRNNRTGLWWTITWGQLVQLAKADGIDGEAV